MGWLEPLFGSDSLEHCGKNLHLQMRTSAEEFLCRSPRPDPGSTRVCGQNHEVILRGANPLEGLLGARHRAQGVTTPESSHGAMKRSPCDPPFIDAETKVQRGEATCPRSHSWY